MLLAEIVLNEQTMRLIKPVAIGGLSLAAIWAFIWPLIKAWFDQLPKNDASKPKNPVKPKDPAKPADPVVNRDSDKQPPEGFSEHVVLVLAASTNAPDSVKIDYLKSGLTEAEVLRKEVERMGTTKKVSDASPVVKETTP